MFFLRTKSGPSVAGVAVQKLALILNTSETRRKQFCCSRLYSRRIWQGMYGNTLFVISQVGKKCQSKKLLKC